jgi:DNA-binding SARP family transcriptional activator
MDAMMLCLTLFGSFSVSLRDSNKVVPLTCAPRVAELLAFLAFGRGRFFLRSDIAESVWNADDAEVTPGSVNTALWRLRHVIEQAPAKPGDFLAVNRQGAVGLNGPGSFSSDVFTFEQLTQASLSMPLVETTQAQRADWCAAIDLYRDNALADFQSDWALRQRERLRSRYLDVLGRLMHLSALQHHYRDAIRYARLVLVTDCLREDVHRELMRYLVLDGQRANALRQFEICRSSLRRELAIQPMMETIAVYRQIAASAVTPDTLAPQAGPEELPRSARLSHHAAQHVLAARDLLAEADRRLQHTLEHCQDGAKPQDCT